MQRNRKNSKADKPEEKLTSEQLLQKEAEAIAREAETNAYLAAQKSSVVGSNPFDSLQSDVAVKIAKHLPGSDARRFANTCRSLFFKERLIPVTRRAANEVHQLLVHVKNGNLEAARTMLELDPGLILEEHSVDEHRWVTALLLAKRMRDVGMCQMLLNRLQAFDEQYGTNHTSLQTRNVCANSLKKAPINTKHFDLAADAIVKYPSAVAVEMQRHRHPGWRRTHLSKEMDAYRRACDEHGDFTAEDFINVSNVLARNARKFKSYDQFYLFFVQVMGYVTRKVPMCFRMALNQGIWDMFQNDNVVDLGARATTRVVKHVHYPLVNFSAGLGLGFDFAFDILWAGWMHEPTLREWRAGLVVDQVRDFCQDTELALVELNLMQPEPEPQFEPESQQPQPEEVKSSRCVIC